MTKLHRQSLAYVVTLVSLTGSGISEAQAANEPPTPMVITGVEPQRIIRGHEVTVTVSPAAKDPGTVIVELDPKAWKKPESVPVIRVTEKGACVVMVPETIRLGSYNVRLVPATKGTASQEPSSGPSEFSITVERDPAEPLVLTAVYPAEPYPEDGKVSFSLIGEGFSDVPEDNVIIVDGQGPLHVDSWLSAGQGATDQSGVVARYISPARIDVSGLPIEHFGGSIRIQVQVGSKRSQVIAFTIAAVAKNTPIAIAIIALCIIAVLILGLARMKRGGEIAGEKYSLMTSFLLDPETDTYSLSKFQFYVWSAVVAFSYAYLALIRRWVQWRAGLPDIPAGVPAIIAISATTAIASTGVTAVHGSKGAGRVQPSFADLVTSGGVVVAERFQFFLWTILGSAGFLFTTLTIDPTQLDKLPEIPQGLLYLMGLSSFGYLGGKVARKPGPIIELVAAQLGSIAGLAATVVEIRGRQIDGEPTIRIDDDEISYDVVDASGSPVVPSSGAVAVPRKDGKLQIVKRGDSDPCGLSVIRLTITDPSKVTKLKGKGETALPKVTVINCDGQFAIWAFNKGWTAGPVAVVGGSSSSQLQVQPGAPSQAWAAFRNLLHLPTGSL